MREWLEPNLDELGPLVRLRHQAEEDRRFTGPRLAELDRRIARHLDALACYAPADLRTHDDPLAMAVALLAAGAPLDDLMEALAPAEVEALARHGSSAVPGTSPRATLVACRLPAKAWFSDDDPWVRRWAWLLGAGLLPTEEPDALVRDAIRRRRPAWTGGPAIEQLAWDARLATPGEAASVADRIWALPPAPATFAALTALGRPADAGELVAFLSAADVRVAVAAGRAFTVLTGADIDSAVRVDVPPDGDDDEVDDFAREFLDEAWLPDPAKARAALAGLPDAPRINRGVAVHDGAVATDGVIDAFEAASARLRLARMAACPAPGPSSTAARY